MKCATEVTEKHREEVSIRNISVLLRDLRGAFFIAIAAIWARQSPQYHI